MHLVPADRLGRKMLDGGLVCEALGAIGESGEALWLLRASGTVAAKRDGRVVRYVLADELAGSLLDRILGHPGELASRGHASH